MKKIHYLVGFSAIIIGIFSLVWVGVARAQSIHAGTDVTVGSNQTINGSFYGASHNVDITGTINGDVNCAGQTIDISGDVHGDVLCAGQTINISGKVDGNIRVAGQSVNIGANVGKNISVVAQTLNLNGNAMVGSDLSFIGNMLTIDGSVGRDITGTAAAVQVNGQVGRNMSLTVNQLSFGGAARVNGTVDYSSNNDAFVSTGAVTGVLNQSAPKERERGRRILFGFSLVGFVYSLLAGLLAALALVLLMPQAIRITAHEAKNKFGWSLLVGFLANIITPIVIFALLFTVIGIPLSLLLLISWLVIMGFSWIIAAYVVGSLLLAKLKNPIVVILIGMLVLVIVVWIPVLGFLVSLVAMWVGVGSILRVLQRYWPKPRYDQS